MSVDLELGNERPFEIRAEVLNSIRELKREIGQIMDDVCKDGESIRIEKLELDLGNIDGSEFSESFIEQLRVALSEKVAKIRVEQAFRANEGELESVDQFAENQESSEFIADFHSREVETLNYFLTNGVLPWWSTARSWDQIEQILADLVSEVIEGNTFHLDQVIRTLRANRKARTRIVTQFTWKQVEELLKAEFSQKVQHTKELLEWFDQLFSVERSKQSPRDEQVRRVLLITWLFEAQKRMETRFIEYLRSNWPPEEFKTVLLNQLKVITADFSEKTTRERIETWIRQFKLPQEIGNSDVEDIIGFCETAINEKAEEEKPERESDANEAEQELNTIQLDYAGIVITWPLLKTLFENRGLLSDKEFRNDESRLKALQLLNYLVAGEDEIREHQMALNKLLCGMHPSDNAFPLPELTAKDKDEVEQLLKHLISTWTVLKNTSPDGLREGFIAREGHLEEKEDFWSVKVEQKSIDVIMSGIPWGYSMIKLAWMPKMIHVEW